MKILVTGGAGYIGSHICVELIEAGHDVIVIDDFSNSKPEVLGFIKDITGKEVLLYEFNLLDEYKCGINCGVESVEDVANAIERLINDEALRVEMGKNSRKLGEERFDRKKSYKNIVNAIEKD